MLVAVLRVQNSSCLNHFLSLQQSVWFVKYSAKVQFKRRSQTTHFSCFHSNLRIIYLIRIMFYDRDNSHRRFLFSIQALYEQCAFCTAPTVLLSFYENKQKVLGCHHLLCAFIVLSLMLSLSLVLSLLQPGKPARWVELQSGSVSGRFRFEVGKAKSQSQPNLFFFFFLRTLRGTGGLGDFHMLCLPLPLSDHLQ